jgi:mercuric ion transport protein
MDKRSGLIGAGGVAAAGLAVLASSCCGIPLALAALGVGGGAIGLLGPLLPLRPLFLALAAVLIGAGWFFAYKRRSRRAYVILAVATLLLLIAVLSPIWEPALTHCLTELRK